MMSSLMRQLRRKLKAATASSGKGSEGVMVWAALRSGAVTEEKFLMNLR